LGSGTNEGWVELKMKKELVPWKMGLVCVEKMEKREGGVKKQKTMGSHPFGGGKGA